MAPDTNPRSSWLYLLVLGFLAGSLVTLFLTGLVEAPRSHAADLNAQLACTTR